VIEQAIDTAALMLGSDKRLSEHVVFRQASAFWWTPAEPRTPKPVGKGRKRELAELGTVVLAAVDYLPRARGRCKVTGKVRVAHGA